MKTNCTKNKILSLFLICFSPLFATASEFDQYLDFTTASVVSGSVQIAESTASLVDASKPENIVIYGGSALAIGSCATPASNSSVCNSCDAITNICAGGVYSCASRSIHPDLRLAITMAFATLPSATPYIRAEYGSGTSSTNITVDTDSIAPTAANQSFTVYIKWRYICQKMGLGDCDTAGSAESEINIGLADGSASSLASGNYQKFTVKVRIVDSATPNTITPATAGTSNGVYDFQMLPGDEKAYIREIKRTSSNPDSAAIRYKSLRVYFKKFSGAVVASDFCAIDPSKDGNVDLDFTDRNTADTTIGKEYLDGLTNETQYIFTGASVDETSIVSEFINVSAAPTQAIVDQYVATPGEVVGLLDKQKCFVATAAFGSPMNEHVSNLRKFRDQVLVKSSVGKDFVRLYYRNSTKWAHFIDQHELLKPIVRFLLWPFVLFAELSLVIGFVATAVIFVLAIGMVIYLIYRKRTKETAV